MVTTRDVRLQTIIAATLRKQGRKPKKKGWITRRDVQLLQRERFLHQLKEILKEE